MRETSRESPGWIWPDHHLHSNMAWEAMGVMINPEADRVLITGAAGAIGTPLRDGLRGTWRHLRLTDVRPLQDIASNEEIIVSDIGDRSGLERMI